MFFPDRAHAYSEARRVLRPGGTFAFNAWDRIEENEFADVATQALARLYPDDPPMFMARTPHGYFDERVIRADVAKAGFALVLRFETIAARSRASSAREAAVAYCQGTPLRNEIQARASAKHGATPNDGLTDATTACTAAIAERFGNGPVNGKIQAHVVIAQE
jgi:SAM-dependent methyltransferase